ncbi:MAG: FKBP-type peptidyl-prolyl cis-trans isomerase [Paludibacteraceae bacterium]|nr:FKBP-type peptidyl-prolyl cis-trans isomerase [Paludibacteraceae bacterium]
MKTNKKEIYKQENKQFLAEIKQQEGVKELKNGVLYKVVASGNGSGIVQPYSVVTCHYKGTLINGRIFDNSYSRNYPEAFRVNELIEGFQLALLNMHVGDHWIVYIPSEMGYGKRSSGDIPGNSTLIFEIELFSIA